MLVVNGNIKELRATLGYGLRIVNFICLPATAGLAVLAVPLFAIFFQRGAFDANATMNSAEALVFFSLGLWSISGTKLVAPVFYALEDTKTPVLIGIVAFLINFAASLALMGEVNMEANPAGFVNQTVASATARMGLISLGHGGLALATSLSSICNFFLLLFILHRRLEGIPLREVAESFLRNLISASLMALPLFWIVRQVNWTGSGIDAYSKVLVLGTLIIFGFSFYLLLSYLLRSPEWEVVEKFWRSLQSRLIPG